jgi:hypothetical protein
MSQIDAHRGQSGMSNHEQRDHLSEPPEAPLEATLADVSAELSRVESLDATPVTTVDQLEQNPPEMGYYEAALESLRSATEAERP